MAFKFDAASLFDIGAQIERHGTTFYQEAAKRASDETLRTLFTELADWENSHLELFQRLKAELPESARAQSVFDPDDEFSASLQAAADSHVFLSSTALPQLLEQCQSPLEVLALALLFEKDSVIYYTTMKKVIPEHLGRANIDLVIDEELKHISLLNAKKQERGSGNA